MAGFISAHAVWSICDGETLIPIYAFLDEAGKRHMQRLEYDRLEDGVEEGKNKLEEAASGVTAKVLIFDGRISLSGEKLDALIVEWRSYEDPSGKAVLAIPYTPAVKGGFFKRARGFAVHRPKILDLSEEWREEPSALLESYFEGVEQHKQGSAVWNEHLDESK